MDAGRFLVQAHLREGRPIGELARTHGVHRSWLYKLLARYRAKGEAGLVPRSRRPRSSPNAMATEIADAIVLLRSDLLAQGLDAGAMTIQWHLDRSTVIDDELDLAHASRAELVELIKALRNGRRTDVVREDKTRHNDLHPTMKPPGLVRGLLANSTRQGSLVLDPFAGSGSTLVAADQLGRRAALIELEPLFCDVIVRRWEALAPGNRAERVRGG